MSVYVLAAGKQTRYEDSDSKMMAYVNGKHAIEYLITTLLTSFTQEQIAIVTSDLFPDFNNFLTENYTQSRLIYDSDPGSGTAHSLTQTLPWNSQTSFVTEGDIWYEPSFISGLIEIHEKSPKATTIVSVTPHVEVVPTHRSIQIFPELAIKAKSDLRDTTGYRNVGAHLFTSKAQEHVVSAQETVIDIIRDIHFKGELVVPYLYTGTLLHIAQVKDLESWIRNFSQQ